jgi:cell division protein ZapA (FtsZ GTPase activity inhibitor)
MSATVKVHLLGRDYQLRSQGDSDLIQEAASLVEEKLSGIPKSVSVDTRDRYMLALLNLAGEYLQEKRKNRALEVERRGWQDGLATAEQSKRDEAELIERIENALKP